MYGTTVYRKMRVAKTDTIVIPWADGFHIRGWGKNIQSSKFYPFLYFRIAERPPLLNISGRIPRPTSRVSLQKNLGTTVPRGEQLPVSGTLHAQNEFSNPVSTLPLRLGCIKLKLNSMV
jgi:hypothetical protein